MEGQKNKQKNQQKHMKLWHIICSNYQWGLQLAFIKAADVAKPRIPLIYVLTFFKHEFKLGYYLFTVGGQSSSCLR